MEDVSCQLAKDVDTDFHSKTPNDHDHSITEVANTSPEIIENDQIPDTDMNVADSATVLKDDNILATTTLTHNGHQEAVNGLLEAVQEDDLLSQIDEMVTSDDQELSSLKLEVSRLESANKYLEDQLSQISQQKDEEIQSCTKSLSEYEAQNQSLRKTVASQFNEIKRWKERVELNDKAARKAIEGYKSEHQTNTDKFTKKYKECKAEKESMVVKYAQGETKTAQLQSTVEKLELRVKDREREKDILSEKLRSLKTESVKHSSSLSDKSTELSSLRQELETHKETISSHEYRTKWAQNKLKSELDAHKETKAKLEEVNRRYKETKEECVTIRKNCQEMIRTYQESEDIKSNSLDIELKKSGAELEEKVARIAKLTQELDLVMSKLEEVSKEASLLKKQSGAGEEKVEELEKINTNKMKELENLNTCILSLREENSQIRTKLQEMQSLQQDLESKESECQDLQSQLTSLNHAYEEYQVEMDSCKKRDGEMLSLTQKMTERNAELQSENSVLKSKLAGIGITSGQQDGQITKLEQSLQQQALLLNKQKTSAQLEMDKVTSELQELHKIVEGLNSDIEGHQTVIKTLKKKQISSVKELTREVHTLKRQLEAHESRHVDESLGPSTARQSSPGRGGSAPDSLSHSRTNSTSSLDKPDSWVVVNHSHQISPEHSKPQASSSEPPPSSDTLEPQFLEPDKQKMIEKIVKLQKINARKNEKLDFCQDHISQLIEEVQRKTRIIQMYAMKEQVGTLSSDSMDRNKSTLAKKGGIMASISNKQLRDDSMNLQLSLKISNQLQALLEDTLLKNIMLKENMDTLGQEIEKISAENATHKRQIQTLQSEVT